MFVAVMVALSSDTVITISLSTGPYVVGNPEFAFAIVIVFPLSTPVAVTPSRTKFSIVT